MNGPGGCAQVRDRYLAAIVAARYNAAVGI